MKEVSKEKLDEALDLIDSILVEEVHGYEFCVYCHCRRTAKGSQTVKAHSCYCEWNRLREVTERLWAK